MLRLLFLVICLAGCQTPLDGSGLGNTESHPTGETQYDLYRTDSMNRGEIPWRVVWPEGPRLDAGCNVIASNNRELNRYKKKAGCRVTVKPGHYDALDGLADDVEIVLLDGAVIRAGNFGEGTKGAYFGGQRQKVVGGQINGGIRVYGEHGATDTSLVGVKIMPAGSTASTVGSGSTVLDLRNVRRFAMIAADVRAVAGQFTLFGVTDVTDVIIANSRIHASDGAAGPVRWGDGATRLVFVDNLVRGTTGYAIFRLHNMSKDIWLRGNQMEANTQGLWLDTFSAPSPSAGSQDRIWVYDNRWYGIEPGNQAPAFQVRDQEPNRVTNLTVDGDRWCSAAYTVGQQILTARPTWDIGENISCALVQPPEWNAHAD